MKLNHHLLYFTGLSLCAVSLPLSPFLLSVSQFFLAGNWILEGNFRNKWLLFKQRRGLLIFLLIFLIHAAGLFNSQDLFGGLNDLKIKLPLFILPLIIATSRSVGEKETNRILLLFSLATLASSLISYERYFSNPQTDIREASLFISYIRLSILVNLSAFSILFLLLRYLGFTAVIYKASAIIVILWLSYFIFLLQSVTGFVIFFFLTGIVSFHVLRSKLPLYVKTLLPAIFGIMFIYLLLNVFTIMRLFAQPNLSANQLERFTESGNAYHHEPANKEMEGGNQVWIYVCESELENEWNRKSDLDFRGKDLKGQELKVTLLRYMASLGLYKDSVGMTQLSDRDIANVESGIASIYYTKKFFPHPRLYQIAWELHRYFNGGNPNGLSVGQRLEYWKTSFRIIRRNPWFGEGTGDVQEAFDRQFELDQSPLQSQYRLRSHNQFITFSISLGIPAMLIMIASIFIPVFTERKIRWFLVQMILCSVLLSMLNEDTLETQAGVSFFAFFYSLLVFGADIDSYSI